MAEYGTKLLDMFNRNIAAIKEPAPAPAPLPATAQPAVSELDELRSQQLMQDYLADLRQNPNTPQPAGLLAGFDKAQAADQHYAQLYGRPSPNNYTGPTIMDLQRLERAQQEAQAQLYAASRT